MAVFIGYVIFLIVLLPAWAVKNASMENRIMMWAFPIFMFGFFGAAVASAMPKAQAPPVAPLARRRRIYACVCVVASFMLAEFLGIAMTYATPHSSFLAGIGDLLIAVGELLFPVVGGYRTSVDPALSPEIVFRLQAIMTSFLLAGLISFFAWLVIFASEPLSERQRSISRMTSPQIPGAMVFAGWMAFESFLGRIDLQRPASLDGKSCLFYAPCYAKDDIMIFFVAFMKVFVIFGFAVGAVALSRVYFSQRQASAPD